MSSREGGASRKETGVSSIRKQRIGAPRKLRTERATSHGVARQGACSHRRRTSICKGLGKRPRSEMNARMASRSQRNMAAMTRGDHHAGTSDSKPNSNITKIRGPNAKETRPRERVRPVMGGGTSSRGAFMPAPLIPRPSLWNFHGCDDLANDLVGGEAFQIRFGLEQEAMAKNGERGRFHVVWQEIVATIHSGESARHEEE